jgi:cell division protein ZipA
VGKVRIVARDNDDDDLSGELAADLAPVPDYDEPTDIDELQSRAQPEAQRFEPDFKSDADLPDNEEAFEQVDATEQLDADDEIVQSPIESSSVKQSSVETQPAENQEVDKEAQSSSNVDIIVLHILAKSSESLTGESINIAARANGLTFGRMNIFHRLDEEEQALFSMANMIEPGNFDPDTIHDMTTSGLTMFMQLSTSAHPSACFDEMLRCAYYLSEMLDADLCNQHRQPITQEDAEYYRQLISEKENA